MVQPKNGPTGPVTLKICTVPIRSSLRPLDGAVMLKNADNADTYRRHHPVCNTADGGDQWDRSPSPRTLSSGLCLIAAARRAPCGDQRERTAMGGVRHDNRRQSKGATDIAAAAAAAGVDVGGTL